MSSWEALQEIHTVGILANHLRRAGCSCGCPENGLYHPFWANLDTHKA